MKKRVRLCKGSIRIISILFLGFLASAPVCADGGKLLFRSEFPAGEYTTQEQEYGNYLTTESQADVQLDSGSIEIFDVYEIGSTSGMQILVSTHRPIRIFSDLNHDNNCQPDELFTSQTKDSNEDLFLNVPIACRIDGVTFTVNLDLQYWNYAGEAFLNIQSVKSDYAGDIELDGVTYPARLVLDLDALDSMDTGVTALVDTDRDGQFDRRTDSFFTCGGYACIDGRIYESQTVISATQADLNLQPYEGTMGLLRLAGSGIRRVHLGYRAKASVQGQIPREMIFSLPTGEAREFRLPIGHYGVIEAWIGSATNSSKLYYLDKSEPNGETQAAIAENAEEILNLGGPLTDSVRVSPNWLMGRVQLDYDGCRNAAGVYYNLVREPTSEASDAPDYEIRDASGVRVASGQFEYG